MFHGLLPFLQKGLLGVCLVVLCFLLTQPGAITTCTRRSISSFKRNMACELRAWVKYCFLLRVALLNNRGLRETVLLLQRHQYTFDALTLSLFCSAFCEYMILCVYAGGERRMDGWMRVESIICMFVATCVHRTYIHHFSYPFPFLLDFPLAVFAMHEIRPFALPYTCFVPFASL